MKDKDNFKEFIEWLEKYVQDDSTFLCDPYCKHLDEIREKAKEFYDKR